jgi:cysteine desulfurase
MIDRAMVYLDHNANSPLRPRARQEMNGALDAFGNASSVHGLGRTARARIEVAREQVARLADAPVTSVVFTSGGSEANALALRGMVAGALAAEDRITRLFVSAIEHESVRANAAALAGTVPGLKVSEIPVTAEGVIDLPALRLALMHGKGRVLVAIMAANNETGALQDVSGVAKLVRAEAGEDSLFHVDAVQAAGRIALSFNASGADSMSLSAHKLGGPQGAGALFLKEGVPFVPLIAGGGQELRRRAGTENVAAIAGFGAAAEEAMDIGVAAPRLQALRDRFERMLRDFAPEAMIFGADAPRLPNTSNFAVLGLSAETAMIALDLDGIAVSSGAACSSGKVQPSHVLSAMGVEENLARGGIRVSFGWNSREDDVDAAIASLRNLVARRAALAA